MVRNRSISSIISNKLTKRPYRTPVRPTRKRDNKVPCHCNRCNGKLVLIRTKLFHESADTTHEVSAVEQPNLNELLLGTGSPAETRIETTDDISPALIVKTTDDNSPNLMVETNDDISPNLPSVPRRRSRRYISHSQATDDMSDSEDGQHNESSLSEDSEYSKRQRIEFEDNESESNDLLISKTFEIIRYQNMNFKIKKRK